MSSNAPEILDGFDATVLAIGSTVPNNLPIPGRELNGIHFAMEFLTQNQQRLFADPKAKLSAGPVLTSKYDGSLVDAAGKNVIVIGGGDTGTDCIATSLRLGAKSITNFELFPRPSSAPPRTHGLRGRASTAPTMGTRRPPKSSTATCAATLSSRASL